jgi:DnaK suppressor protein
VLFLAIMVVLLPLDAYERQASLALASEQDPIPREEEISMSNGEAPLDASRARELVQRERERIEGSLRELGQLRESGLGEADNATNVFDDGEVIEEREVDEALKEQLRAELEAVKRAEKRLEDGVYGFSVESGEPIPAQRLETIPWAERTAEEQQRYERTHGRAL